jgi:hypothetical protein
MCQTVQKEQEADSGVWKEAELDIVPLIQVEQRERVESKQEKDDIPCRLNITEGSDKPSDQRESDVVRWCGSNTIVNGTVECCLCAR